MKTKPTISLTQLCRLIQKIALRGIPIILEAFLQKNSRKTKNYSPYFELWRLLKAINFGRMEMSEVVFGPTIICPYVKLDTMRDISICLTIIYTHINCRIKPNLMFISDEVQLHLDKFESQVEQFLFS